MSRASPRPRSCASGQASGRHPPQPMACFGCCRYSFRGACRAVFEATIPVQHVRKLQIGEGWAAWPWEMIELVRARGPAWMWRATALALFTGQRQGDVLEMTWGAVKGGLVEVRQEKTGRRLVIPAHQSLLAVLAEVPRHSTRVLTNTRGLPWTKSGFKASWQKALKGPLATDPRTRSWCSTVFASRPSLPCLRQARPKPRLPRSPDSRGRWSNTTRGR